jgi:hypothetical protein
MSALAIKDEKELVCLREYEKMTSSEQLVKQQEPLATCS